MTAEMAPGAARLSVSLDNGTRDFDFSGGITIGRSRDNDVVIDSSDVSRHHARIDSDDAGFSLTDLGSANGTKLNDRTLGPRMPFPLTHGDIIQLGSIRIAFHAPSAVRHQPTVTAPQPGSTGTVPQYPPAHAPVGTAAQSTPVVQSPPRPPRPEPEGTVVAVQRPRLVLTTPRGARNFVLDRDLTIGRDPANDIVVEHEAVAPYHARVRAVGRTHIIEDLGSPAGVVANGQRVPSHTFVHGDIVRLGPAAALRYETLYGPGEAVEERILPLPAGSEITVGRAGDCNCVVSHPTVSRLHARIGWLEGGRTRVVEDLGSSNGTFVNGDRLAPRRRRELRQGDVIRIGPMRLLLSGKGLATADDSRGVRLDAVHLNQHVSADVNLLQDLSFSIQQREFVAVVGVSGAGKSTLLGALSGFRPSSDGAVLVNGVDLYRNFDAYRTSIGYVPQDDILHKELPVRRALEFAAELRLPSDTSAYERQLRVDEVLATLDLTQRADVPIARLSGGQRKRVSIGAELLTRPALFFLDEATSGLDPGTESQLMRLLRRLADDGHTIILVTHATKNVMLCDQVVFLARGGHLAYYGPPEQALLYFSVEDFDGIYEKLEGTGTPPQWASQYRASPQYAEFAAGRLASAPALGGRSAAPSRGHAAPGRPNPLKQLVVLSRRYVDIIRRDRTNLLLLLLLAPVLGLLDLVFPRNMLQFAGGDSTRSMVALFLAAIIPFLVGSISSVREIVKEHAIYLRERTVSLGIAPYLLSKVSVGFLFALYHGLALFFFKAIWFEFPDAEAINYLQMYVTLALTVMSGVMWGLLISALAPREEQAMLLVIGVVVVQIVFSGGLLALGELGVTGRVLGGITSTNWAFRAMVESAQVRTGNCDVATDLAECRLPGLAQYQTSPERHVAIQPIDERYGDIFNTDVVVAWIGMIAIMVVLFAVLYFLQKRKDVV